MELTLFNAIVAVCIAIGFAALNAAYLVWAERRGAGRIQRRPGPNINGPLGLLQPPLDGIKLMAKQLIIPGGADKGWPEAVQAGGMCTGWQPSACVAAWLAAA